MGRWEYRDIWDLWECGDIPDSQFPTPNSRLPIPDSRFPIPDSRLPTPDSRLPTPDSLKSQIYLTYLRTTISSRCWQVMNIADGHGAS
ncbi:MAG: hypothetical protein F6K50_13195 [Moorea sp. SIO3I7]|nr:hypothetical protein [Moorena sp. SIO3I7]